jgi:hypothetical protein
MSAAKSRISSQPAIESLEQRAHFSVTHPEVGTGMVFHIPARLTLRGGIFAGTPKSNVATGGYTERIHWGDGSLSVASAMAADNGGILLPLDLPQGGHTYTHFGKYKVTIELENAKGAVTDVIHDVAVVTQNLTGGKTVRATTAAPIRNKLVGIFDNRIETFDSAATASVDWGDGTAASAAMVVNRGNLTLIYASHQFNKAGTFHTSIVYYHPGGSPPAGPLGTAMPLIYFPSFTQTITGKAIVTRR